MGWNQWPEEETANSGVENRVLEEHPRALVSQSVHYTPIKADFEYVGLEEKAHLRLAVRKSLLQ
jgi:hypothetical protein